MFVTLFFSAMISIRIVLFFKFINIPHKPPLFGVYQQKNKYYWFKYLFLFIFLTVKQWLWRFKRAYAVDVGRSCDGTKHVHEEDAILEQKFDLGQYPNAVDDTYFNGISKDGTALVFALARRQDNVCDAMAYIKINGENYLSPKLPDTYLKQDESDYGEFKVQGIQILNFIPMRTWILSYNGDMKLKSDPEKKVSVKADLTWSALFSPFIYEYQMSTLGVASDMAREPWTKDYFGLVQKLHQTHYEQMGSLTGTVTIDGKEHILKMPCSRYRASGKFRDWRNYHRCVYHTLYLDNGDCIAVSTLSQPFTVSHLTVGFVCRSSHQAGVAVESSDFKLYQHGENQIPPKDYGFTCKAGGKCYTVRVAVEDESVGYIGKQREVKCFDRWLTVDVNGVSGRGFSRWLYNAQTNNNSD